jgi:hypothetical protein
MRLPFYKGVYSEEVDFLHLILIVISTQTSDSICGLKSGRESSLVAIRTGLQGVSEGVVGVRWIPLILNSASILADLGGCDWIRSTTSAVLIRLPHSTL